MWFVGRGVFAEADVPVDSEGDVLYGEFGDGFVEVDYCEGCGVDEGVPVFEGASVFAVMGWLMLAFYFHLTNSLNWCTCRTSTYILAMISCCWPSGRGGRGMCSYADSHPRNPHLPHRA